MSCGKGEDLQPHWISNAAFFFKKGWIIPPEKCHFLFDIEFLLKEVTNLASNFTCNKQCFESTVPDNAKDDGLEGMYDYRLWGRWNQSLFWNFVQCSETHAVQVYFMFGIIRRYLFCLVSCEI
jgi:hypothetical protein